MTWPDWLRPSYYTTDLSHWSRYRIMLLIKRQQYCRPNLHSRWADVTERLPSRSSFETRIESNLSNAVERSCLHHLIPPVRDTSVTTRLRLTTSLPRPDLRTKKYCSFINFGLHHYQPTQWLLTHSTHLSQNICTYMHIVCFVCCFIYYFNCISFAIRLSGCSVAIKLIDWLD